MIDFKKELGQMAEPQMDASFLAQKDEVNAMLAMQEKLIAKQNKQQSMMSIQLEEMYLILEEQQDKASNEDTWDDEKNRLVQALIASADLFEQFYLYVTENREAQFIEQVALMWRTLMKEINTVGLQRIADEQTPFDARLNHIEGVTSQGEAPDGFIMKVLSSGYIYQDKIYRKSGVIVKRAEENPI